MERLTTKQASEILGVSQRRVIALIEQGKLKADKFASVYTIAQKDLETVRNRKNGRPAKVENGTQTNGNEKRIKTIFDIAPELAASLSGKHENLPSDLSTNKKYLEGLGRG